MCWLNKDQMFELEKQLSRIIVNGRIQNKCSLYLHDRQLLATYEKNKTKQNKTKNKNKK